MNILLGVCGSISAYKTFDIARGLVKKGHNVRVILTKGALEFVKPEVYKYLGIEDVYTYEDDFNYPKYQSDKGVVLHIELAKWADRFMICPLSANTLASLAMGRASDLLTSTYLAFDQEKPVLLYPAMNTLMYEHPLTQANLDLVQRLSSVPNTIVIQPDSGLLACGDTGAGKLPDVEKIIESFDTFNLETQSDKIVITTGATIAPIDPVRFMTNSSSGLTGYLLAKQALKEGYKVTVLAGINATKKLDHLLINPNFELKRVTTTTQMRDLALREIEDACAYVSSAALCDFEFDYLDEKLKKKNSISNSFEYTEAPDVLKEVIEKKQVGLSIIGFAAETNLTEQMLQEKWNRKPVSLLIGTHVNSGLMKGSQKGFGEDQAKYTFFSKQGVTFDGNLSKEDLAKYIIGNVNQ